MPARKRFITAIGVAFFAATFNVAAQPADASTQKSEPIYGYRMMDDQERNAYREKMRNARSAEERQTVRDEHRKAMEARAKERGVTLPAPRGPGYGPGTGGRSGMGPGPGYGPGAGSRSGRGPGAGPGPRPDCPGAQDCPSPGSGKGQRNP